MVSSVKDEAAIAVDIEDHSSASVKWEGRDYANDTYLNPSSQAGDLEKADPLGDEVARQKAQELEQENGNGNNGQSHLGHAYPQGFVLYACVISLVLSLFLAALDIMIVATLIEDVARQFHDYSNTGWIFSGYTLPNAVLCLLWGRIAAVIGFKSSMLASIFIFEIGSLISGVATSLNMLIGGRVVSGIGGSGIQSLVFVIAFSLVEERKKGIVIAFLSSAFGLSSVAGPFIGGAFTSHVTWRWCFYINLPIGGLAFTVFVLFYNPTGERKTVVSIVKDFFTNSYANMKKLKCLAKFKTWKFIVHSLIFQFDIIECIICSAGLVLVLIAFSFGGNKYRWDSGNIIAMFVIGILLIIFALVYDFAIFPRFKTVRGNVQYQPLMKWENFKKPGIFTANSAVFFQSITFSIQMVYLVQFFQLVYNDTAWNAAVHLLAAAIPTVISVMFSGVLNSKTGYIKPITVVGGIFSVVGAGALTRLNNHSTNSQHIGLLILPGLAFGAILQSSMLGCQNQVDKNSPTARIDFISVVTLNNFLKVLGQAFGGIVCETVFSASILNKLKQHNIQLGTESTVNELIIYRGTHFDGATSLMGDLISQSIVDVFYMALGCAALAFISGVLTSNKKNDVRKHPPSPSPTSNQKSDHSSASVAPSKETSSIAS
ncbi:hypothetical protein HG535_0D00900 [Zygotorulaspora mrakii]|uniref:Major facilitator superfamily (MFS) profile domain-containing protein n=1 Tax=Zygotorulaspora mrakii TaxID=42260 RepID=A0A7H9B3Q6_ZYGMR|nr:uncharacterized protein HG535_0D00900 [Zygotorulaspora mrakii]QLG72382.1 hypothetical protein HG535_0D00900 [Zygotorulaspora mrakii]